MTPLHQTIRVLVFGFAIGASSHAADWSAWRGPTGNGVAGEGETAPVRWSESENVAWKIPIPGRGHSAPITVGELLILTTADERRQVQTVLAYDRKTGAERWRRDLHTGHFVTEIHRKNSQATPSPCSDGGRVFVVFHNGGRIHLSALDLAGALLWTRDTGPYRCRYGYGYAPSPVIAGSLVIVSSEFEKDGNLAAFDRLTGEERWRTPRNGTTSYSTPALATAAGREQIVITGNKRMESYDPATGRELWAVDAITLATCGTAVWEGDLVFASGGFPNKETAAVRADGSGAIVWKNGVKCYEQSMVVHDGHLYAIDDGGIAYCWNAATGEEKWKSRLGGPVSSSPILVGSHLYFTNERGITYVVKATPDRFETVAENSLGDEAFPTPIFSEGRLYFRNAKNEGESRQEWLYCIGPPFSTGSVD